MDTLELLLKHYGFRPFTPLEETGSLWGHTEKTMTEKIDVGDIRLPYFTSDGKQKPLSLSGSKPLPRSWIKGRTTQSESSRSLGAECRGDPLFLAPLIAQHQGMRQEEILELHLWNFRSDQGVAFIHGTNGAGQCLKTATAYRSLLIHRHLLALGLLERVGRQCAVARVGTGKCVPRRAALDPAGPTRVQARQGSSRGCQQPSGATA